MIRRCAVVVVIACLLSTFAQGRKDPVSGTIRVLYIGDYSAMSPYPMLEAEPLVTLNFAWPSAMEGMPTSLAKRMFRQYIPRTYEGLAENDAIIISDADVFIFEDQHYVWFRDAVRENGSGLVMIGGNAGFGGRPNPPWSPTAVQEILPVWCIDGGWTEGTVEVLRRDHEFTATLPLDKRWPWMAHYDGNKVILKQGAELLAEFVLIGGARDPFWATWDPGEGRCFGVMGDWTPAGGTRFMRWSYYGDFAVNLMLYLSRNPIPSDLETLHKARGMFLDYRSTREYLFSVMDFAEKLGANMNPVAEMIGEAGEIHETSVDAYIQYEFQTALARLDEAIASLLDAANRAMELKDQAMTWIYVIEWFTVTATFAVGGFVIWTLMVRRRLYREAGQTRFAR